MIETRTLLATKWYYYNDDGNVTRIVTETGTGGGGPCPFGGDQYKATRFEFAKNGQTVTYVMGETWCWNEVFHSTSNYEVTYAREFRYDGARQRYLDRELDPDALELGNIVPISETWTDYDGDEAYGDYTVSGIDVTERRSFEPGLAKVEPWASSGAGSTDYYHSDHLGTTRFMTDSTGAQSGQTVYSAFGEPISGTPDNRYGYVGAWGYQTHDEFPFLHVGARYYDAASGRFLQRDPIGIAGGTNVYDYASNSPLITVDPSGLIPAGAGAVGEGGKVAIEGGKALADAAQAAISDAPRRHRINTHPGLSRDDWVKGCPICKRLKRADRVRRTRKRNKASYPKFSCWAPWNWGLNSWYDK